MHGACAAPKRNSAPSSTGGKLEGYAGAARPMLHLHGRLVAVVGGGMIGNALQLCPAQAAACTTEAAVTEPSPIR